jgi:hypothetical protein
VDRLEMERGRKEKGKRRGRRRTIGTVGTSPVSVALAHATIYADASTAAVVGTFGQGSNYHEKQGRQTEKEGPIHLHLQVRTKKKRTK